MNKMENATINQKVFKIRIFTILFGIIPASIIAYGELIVGIVSYIMWTLLWYFLTPKIVKRPYNTK